MQLPVTLTRRNDASSEVVLREPRGRNGAREEKEGGREVEIDGMRIGARPISNVLLQAAMRLSQPSPLGRLAEYSRTTAMLWLRYSNRVSW